ncbi:hypothetical protein P3T37_005380 [Kitasatospora sp. MAA4]|uniref:hypothetical protein n=1 Tax=Kitasatospora sp. MAA4 TaxID=3035093 RepID=UPI002475D088|nr:hypothetical protein [Kitasatospora sp. MAA4]MDH6135961.1 hypothetical protein [Kitasatospora sp. MAA4]
MPKLVPARPWRLPLAVMAGTQAVWLCWWAAFHPGLISFDSVMYTWQVSTGHWASDHSVLYDCLVWLALHLPGRFALLTLLQTTAMSAVLGYACVALRGLGVRARWSAGAALAVAALPPTGTFVVFVWKDVPFTISAVLVFAAGARLLAHRGAGGRRFDLMVLGVGLFGVGLFRNANEGMVLIAGVALLVVLPGLRRALAVLTAAAVLVPLAGQLWLYPAVGIRQPPANAVFALNYSDIAVAYQKAPGLFSAADQRLLTEVAPLSTWQAGANCHSGDALTNSSAPFDRAAADRVNGQLLALWTALLEARPDLVIGARICRGHIGWAPFSDPTRSGASTIVSPLDRSPDLWGWTAPVAAADLGAGHLAPNGKMVGSPHLPALASRPLSSTLHEAGIWLHTASRVSRLDWLLWRGATWCYLAYAALALYAAGRRRGGVLALGGILLGLQLTLIAANPAELFRYNVVPLFVGPLCLGLLAAGRAPIRFLKLLRLRRRTSPTGARSRPRRTGRG